MGTNILVVNKKKNQYKTLELKEEIKNIHNKMQEDVTYEIEN